MLLCQNLHSVVGVRNALDDVIKSQKENVSDEAVKAAQDRLNEVYDTFSKKYGFINGQGNTRLFRQDAAFPLVSSAEVLDEDRKFVSKGDIFTKRTIKKAVAITHADNLTEALILSVSQKGNIHFDYMEELTGKSRKEIIEGLKGEIFLNLDSFEPSDATPFSSAMDLGDFSRAYVTADEYLSGNIREKVEVLDAYIKNIEQEIVQNEEMLKKSENGAEINDNEKRLEEERRIEAARIEAARKAEEERKAAEAKARFEAQRAAEKAANKKQAFNMGMRSDTHAGAEIVNNGEITIVNPSKISAGI